MWRRNGPPSPPTSTSLASWLNLTGPRTSSASTPNRRRWWSKSAARSSSRPRVSANGSRCSGAHRSTDSAWTSPQPRVSQTAAAIWTQDSRASTSCLHRPWSRDSPSHPLLSKTDDFSFAKNRSQLFSFRGKKISFFFGSFFTHGMTPQVERCFLQYATHTSPVRWIQHTLHST